jgi:hypothetical protein
MLGDFSRALLLIRTEYQIAVLWEKSEILVGSLPQSEENDESEG